MSARRTDGSMDQRATEKVHVNSKANIVEALREVATAAGIGEADGVFTEPDRRLEEAGSGQPGRAFRARGERLGMARRSMSGKTAKLIRRSASRRSRIFLARRPGDERPQRRAMVQPGDTVVRRQCAPPTGCSSVYRPVPVSSTDDLASMRIDDWIRSGCSTARGERRRAEPGRPGTAPSARRG